MPRTIYNWYNALDIPPKCQGEFDSVNLHIEQFMKHMEDIGLNVREISHALINEITTREAEMVLIKAAKMKKGWRTYS